MGSTLSRRVWLALGVLVATAGAATATVQLRATPVTPLSTPPSAAIAQTLAAHRAAPTRSQLAVESCASPASFLDVAGQGPVCYANGSWVMRFGRSQQARTVSPPDLMRVLASSPAPPAHAAAAALSSQQCVNPATHTHVELYYAHFSDQPDNYASHLADIQQMFRDVDGIYFNYDATTYFGVGAHLYVECDASGNPVVHDVGLSTPLGNSNFAGIANDMANQGHTSGLAHYWVWTDGNPLAAFGYAGQSTIEEDDSAGSGNVINGSYEYSVNYGFTSAANGAQIFAHENGHAMGAVQLSAPDSTGAWHCTDGYDVMCYNDGGPLGSAYRNTSCSPAPNGTLLFDCHFNDYFNPGPAAGTYLATHWNLAGPSDHWLYLVPASSSTALTLSASTAQYTQPVTLTATVSASATPHPGTPAGTVTFYDGSAALGSAALDASGVASLTTSSLALGSHTLSASYGGSNAYSAGGSGSASLTVGRASSATAVSASSNPAPLNAPLTITATVSAQSPATGTPTGGVTFYDGATQLGTGTLNGSGQAAISRSLAYGAHVLWASYAGDSGFASSDDQASALAETVLFPTTTTLTGGSTQAVELGTPLTFTATVSVGAGVPGGQSPPTGSITFKDGSTVLGTVPLSGNHASMTTSALSPGSRQVNAVYSGDPAFVPSTGTLNQTVNGFRSLYELDGFGGLHPVASGQLPAVADSWPGWNIARGVVLRSDGQSGYILDAFGGVHPFGGAPYVTSSAYWPGWGIARGIVLRSDGQSGYVLDGFGGLHPFGGAPQVAGESYWPGWDIARGVVLRSSGAGGYVLDGWGGIHPFGSAPNVSATGYWPRWDIARAIVMLPGNLHMGYVLDAFGGLHAFGGAPQLSVPSSNYFSGQDIVHALSVQ